MLVTIYLREVCLQERFRFQVYVGGSMSGSGIFMMNYEVGLGVEGSPATGIGVQLSTKYTIAVVPLIKF